MVDEGLVESFTMEKDPILDGTMSRSPFPVRITRFSAEMAESWSVQEKVRVRTVNFAPLEPRTFAFRNEHLQTVQLLGLIL